MSKKPPLTDFGSLPSYSAVLTAAGGELDLRVDVKREEFAILLLAPAAEKNVWLLAHPASSQHERISLKRDAEQRGYTVSTVRTVTVELLRDIHAAHASGKTATRDKAEDSLNDEDSIRWIDSMLTLAIDLGATDIHIEAREHGSRVRMRIHGVLDTVARPEPRKMLRAIAASYSVLADPSTRSDSHFSFTIERNCIIERPVEGQPRRFRFESFPVLNGMDCVLRVLQGSLLIRTLDELGYAPSHVELLQLAMMASSGLIVVTGTTGSGKTTALLSLLALHPHLDQIKTIALEDPSEYAIDGISQWSIQRGADDVAKGEAAYVEAARTFLRADPDQAMIGEIRGPDVGQVVVALVQTGHKCLTTVHAAAALYVIPRMAHAAIGIDRQTACAEGFLSLLAYQALLPRLCPHCAQPAKPALPVEYLRLIESTFGVSQFDDMRVQGPGCRHCRNGLAGQTLAAEVIMPDAELLRLLREGRDAEATEYWRQTRSAGFAEANMDGKTAFEHGLFKVLHGDVDPRHLERVIEPIGKYRFRMPHAGAKLTLAIGGRT